MREMEKSNGSLSEIPIQFSWRQITPISINTPSAIMAMPMTDPPGACPLPVEQVDAGLLYRSADPGLLGVTGDSST
jgi:hypothetical protein